MENFENLLELYLNEDEIKEKINEDDKTLDNEEITSSKFKTKEFRKKYLEEIISIDEFLKFYLNSNYSGKNLYHSGLKSLNIPIVIGISNEYALKNPELVKSGYVKIVSDAENNLGTYINPLCILELINNKKIRETIKLHEKALKKGITDMSILASYYQECVKVEKEKSDAQITMYNETLTNAVIKENHKTKKVRKLTLGDK